MDIPATSDPADSEIRPRTPVGALVAARAAVESHWRRRWNQGVLASEVEQTGLLLAECGDRLNYVQFAAREEHRVGADWLWWFVDDKDEAFGLLVQAKRLHRTSSGWRLDVGYRTSDGTRQIDRLLSAADALDVPAAYTLYCGTADYRQDLKCDGEHVEECARCRDSAVTFVAAVIAEWLLRRPSIAESAFARSRPIEQLLTDAADRQIYLIGLRTLSADLRDYLATPQVGCRAVAKSVLAQVVDAAMGQTRAKSSERLTLGSAAVFDKVPDDRAHFARPYLQHVLRGLRNELPLDVRRVIEGHPPPAHYAELAGLAVLRV
jgi:hypothetical protein